MDKILFSETKIGKHAVKNRFVMAPMTRGRAIDGIPNELMAEYYGQRTDMGMIITEGTAPSPDGSGYARMPGIWLGKHIEGWKKITKRVQADRGIIFLQLMHTGRVGHPDNMNNGSRVMAPSEVAAPGTIHTDVGGEKPFPVPDEMTLSDIRRVQEEFVRAAERAMTAGFHGVELHGAHGYLIDQFLQPCSNLRNDVYGGSIENRCRFALELVTAIINSIGPDKTAVRISPHGTMNGVVPFEKRDDQFVYFAEKLNELGIVYLHISNDDSSGGEKITSKTLERIRRVFKKKIILCGGYDFESAEEELFSGPADLIAFGKPVIANPDFVHRCLNGIPLNKPDRETFYSQGKKGYTDYPLAKV